jgi:hypothetical protein
MILYWHPNDDKVINVSLGVGEDEGWWGGIQLSGVTIVLAASLALTTASTAVLANNLANSWQDDPANTLHGQYDEDFWNNSVPPVPATLGPLYLPDPEYIPAGTLYGPPLDEFWVNPVAPVQAVLAPLYLPDPEYIPANTLRAPADEVYWQPQTQQQWPSTQAFIDDEIIVLQPVIFSLDEDFWSPQIPPQLWAWTSQLFSEDAFPLQQVAPTQPNYICSGAHNFVSQDMGLGVQF